MLGLGALHWDLFLRGAVAALLLLHLLNLALPGRRPQVRLALAGFVASVLAYLFCQRPLMLLELPRPLAYALLLMCVTNAGWLWTSARALFDDHFDWRWPAPALLALLVVGLAANLPYFPSGDGPFIVPPHQPWVVLFGRLHALANLGFTAAALWEVARGWRADLVATRRVARRWVAMGIGVYAALALVIELALHGADVGLLLPALHVAGIGAVALALALFIARRSLDEVLGSSAPPPIGLPAGPPAVAALPDKAAQALDKLNRAMRERHEYRREGLTVAELASTLGLGEAALRELINQRLGFRNFNDFLHHHRLQEAAARLGAEDLPVLSIALECGYGSIGPFNRAFKQRFGITPTEFRVSARLAGAAKTI
jgi:AraC-like DNA-binding protein